MTNLKKNIFILSLIMLSISLYAQQQITVGNNVHVSKLNSNHPHYEIHFAADPQNRNNIFGGSMMWSQKENKYDVVTYLTSDNSKSWISPLSVVFDWMTNDPAAAYGNSNYTYLSCFGYDKNIKATMLFYSSTDAGQTWLPPVEIPSMDREFITVDNTGGKYDGTIYVNGTRGTSNYDDQSRNSGLTIIKSTDHGKTFSGPFTYNSLGDNYVLGMGNGVVLSNGEYLVLFGERTTSKYKTAERPSSPNAQLKILISDPNAENANNFINVTRTVKISDWYMRFGGNTSMVPSLAVDRSHGLFKDRLYVTWNDFRSGRSDILFSYSKDEGKTWSKPIVVNDDPLPPISGQGPDHFMPIVEVNKDGIVGLMWYDRRDYKDNLSYDVRFSASLDGGDTFLPSIRVSEAPFDFSLFDGLVFWGLTSGGGHPSKYRKGGNLNVSVGLHHFNMKGGDTSIMIADADGVFQPFWIDNRTGIPQVWTAKVKVNDQIANSNFEDLTEYLTIELFNPSYDNNTHTLNIDAQLKNTSEKTLLGPLHAKVISLKSQFGIPEIINADNSIKKTGAVIYFDNIKQLHPGQKSLSKNLQFAIKSFTDLKNVDNLFPISGSYMLIDLDLKISGKVNK